MNYPIKNSVKPTKKMLNTWKDMTNNNEHTEVLIAISKWLYKNTEDDGFNRLITALKYVKREHEEIGHLPEELCIIRSCIMRELNRRMMYFVPHCYEEIQATM